MQSSYDKVSTWLDSMTSSKTEKILNNFRLPRHALPTAYDLEIYPDFYKSSPSDFTFSGTVRIDIHCYEDADNITLHSANLATGNVSIHHVTSVNTDQQVSINRITEDKERQFLIINLSSNLKTGSDYRLKIDFNAPLTNSLNGIYYSSYAEGSGTKYVLSGTYSDTILPLED